MARDLKALQDTVLLLLLLLLLFSFILMVSEARPMKDLKLEDSVKMIMLEKFYLGAIKHSGPSPNGPGHKSLTTVNNIQDSGAGHEFFSRMHH